MRFLPIALDYLIIIMFKLTMLGKTQIARGQLSRFDSLVACYVAGKLLVSRKL